MVNIWKDKYFSIGTGDTMTYSVRLNDGTTIYTGKAYKKPNETAIKVKINDIVADYLAQNIPSQEHLVTGQTSMLLPVSIYNENGLVATETFRNDWSYTDFDGATASDPICTDVDNGQPLIISRYSTDDIVCNMTFNDGTTATINIPVFINGTEGDFISEENAEAVGYFNPDFLLDARQLSACNACLNLENFPNLKEVSFGGTTYHIVGNCGLYAFYYINAHGGWDTLLLKNDVKVKDTITRYTHKRVYDNSVATDRGKDNYTNGITRNYTCYTDWLSDEQAGRMHHLLESTAVFLYDIQNGEMMPVVITDTECEKKTFKGEGRKPVRYTINAELARDITRR